MTVSKMFDRVIHPARGRDGGHAGAPGSVSLDDGTVLTGMGRDSIPGDRRLVIVTPGGGGIGDPTARDPEAVADDIAEGFVSETAGRETYGRADAG